MANDTQNIQINIKAETNKATSQVKKLNKEIRQLKKESDKSNKSLAKTQGVTKKVGASFKQLGLHLARLVAIYGTFQAMTNTVKTFANFEQAIKTLGVITGVTGEQLQALEDKAKELGETTVFSASQVAEAMTEMARAGLTAEQQLEGIDGVLNLAINGMVSLAEASKIATTAMNAFGLKSSDIGNISDVFSKAINSSAMNLEQLGYAMAKVAPVSKSMNVSLEETTALLGVLADAGRRGAEAGTQLKIVMLRLGANVEAKKWIDGLGASMYKSNGVLKSFTSQLRAIQDGMVGLTQKQQLLAKARIFGSEALASAEILLSNLEKIDPATEKLRNSFGYAQDNATKMMDTLQGSYKELLSALEGLQVEIGENLSPALRKIIEDSTEFIRGLDAEQIEAFTDDLSSLIGVLGEFYNGLEMVMKMAYNVASAFGVINAKNVVLLALMVKFKAQLLSMVSGLAGILAVGGAFAGLALGAIALGVALGVLIYKIAEMEQQTAELNETTDKFVKSMVRVDEVLENTFTKIDDLSESKIRDYLLTLGKETKSLINQLTDLGDELAELEKKKLNSLTGISDRDAKRIEQINNLMGVLSVKLGLISEAELKLKKSGQELVNERQKVLRLLALEKNSRYAIANDAIPLEKEQLKAVVKTTKAYEKRLKTLKSTLTTMEKKERGFVKDLIKLEKQLSDVRKKHANERLSHTHKFETSLADIRANALNSLGQYNDAQKRADEELAKAKEYLAKGNLIMAEEHHAEYMRLVQVNATDEIKIGDDVKRTKQQNMKELLSDTKAGNEIATKIMLERQQKEEDLIKKNIALKLNELNMFRVQMDIQIQLIKLMAELAGYSKDLAFSDQLKAFNVEAEKAEVTIDRLVGEQRQLIIDIDMNAGGLSGDISKVSSDLKKIEEPIKPEIDFSKAIAEIEEVEVAFNGTKAVLSEQQFLKVKADKAELDALNLQLAEMMSEDKELILSADTSEAKSDFEQVKAKAEQLEANIEKTMTLNVETLIADKKLNTTADLAGGLENIDIEVDADTTDADRELTALVKKGNDAKIIPKVTLNTSKADSQMRQKEKEWSRTITKTIQINYVGQQTAQNGGLILPRFADGGHLDSGLGHSRKTGSLSGYGGGDKIKALLEAGEFIIKKESVRKLGLDRLNMINQGKLPRYQDGGGVSIPRYATGGGVSSSNVSSRTVELNLNMGGQSFKMMTDEDVASALERYTRINL